jgi:CheY-like chemotaxis protein
MRTLDERIERARTRWDWAVRRRRSARTTIQASRWLLACSRATLDRPRPGFRGAADHPRLDHISVLVVDDDETARYVWARYLAHCGATVRAVATAEHAVRALRSAAADVVVVDLVLPGLDGLDVLKTIRVSAPTALVLAVTGFTGTEDQGRALRDGFDVSLPKPLDPRVLAETIAFRGARRSPSTPSGSSGPPAPPS